MVGLCPHHHQTSHSQVLVPQQQVLVITGTWSAWRERETRSCGGGGCGVTASVVAQVRLEAGDEMVRWDAVLWPHTTHQYITTTLSCHTVQTLQTHISIISHISQTERDRIIIICSVRGPASGCCWQDIVNDHVHCEKCIVRFYNYLPETLASSRW